MSTVPSRYETPAHTADLVERHVFSVPYLRDRSWSDTERIWDECADQAHAWANAQGVEIDCSRFESSEAVGVHCYVTVGKSTDDQWTWSSRWRHWWRTFRTMSSLETVSLIKADLSGSCAQLDEDR